MRTRIYNTPVRRKAGPTVEEIECTSICVPEYLAEMEAKRERTQLTRPFVATNNQPTIAVYDDVGVI